MDHSEHELSRCEARKLSFVCLCVLRAENRHALDFVSTLRGFSRLALAVLRARSEKLGSEAGRLPLFPVRKSFGEPRIRGYEQKQMHARRHREERKSKHRGLCLFSRLATLRRAPERLDATAASHPETAVSKNREGPVPTCRPKPHAGEVPMPGSSEPGRLVAEVTCALSF
jgi:hypothetical protein